MDYYSKNGNINELLLLFNNLKLEFKNNISNSIVLNGLSHSGLINKINIK